MMAKTIRVRIPVLVAPDGSWAASCWHYDGHATPPAYAIKEHIEEMFDPSLFEDVSGFRLSYVEADVPLPEPAPETVVEGKVSDG